MKFDASIPSYELKGVGVYSTTPNYGDPNYRYEYHGGFVPDSAFSADAVSLTRYNNWGLPSSFTDGLVPSLAPYYSQVYPRLRPQIEKAGLAVFLGEIRDTPRMLKTTAKFFQNVWKGLGGSPSVQTISEAPKELADHFLNHQFGWVPFIADLIKFDDVYQNSKEYIKQLVRDNNQWVRRVRVIDTLKVRNLIEWNYTGYGAFPNAVNGVNLDAMRALMTLNGQSCYAGYSVNEYIDSRIWCAGEFKYYRKEFDINLVDFESNWNKAMRLLDVYGARISPANLYRIIPWSWLVDWFTNIGRIIDAANDAALDGVVAKYMYLMHDQVRRLTCQMTSNFWDHPICLEWHRYSEVKQRQDASSPYEFNAHWNTLTPMRLAILAALGITRRAYPATH